MYVRWWMNWRWALGVWGVLLTVRLLQAMRSKRLTPNTQRHK
jgi:hypothetical protein